MSERFNRWVYAQMQKHGITSVREIERRTGIRSSTMSAWFTGETEPAPRSIERLAVLFDVEPREIYEVLDRIEPVSPVQLDELEMRIIQTYRSLESATERQRFLKLAEAFSGYQAENESEEDHPLPSQG